MQARIRFLFREGREIPGWQHCMTEFDVEGIFGMQRIGRMTDEHRRVTIEATLLPADGSRQIGLVDAVVIWLKDNRMRVTGLEYDDLTKKYTLQAWNVEFCKP